MLLLLLLVLRSIFLNKSLPGKRSQIAPNVRSDLIWETEESTSNICWDRNQSTKEIEASRGNAGGDVAQWPRLKWV